MTIQVGHRLDTGRLEGNRFGTRGTAVNAFGVMFPDRHAVVEGTSAKARAYRRHVAGLRNPLPLRAGRPLRPEFGTRTRRHSAS